jgi:hypothetical protein
MGAKMAGLSWRRLTLWALPVALTAGMLPLVAGAASGDLAITTLSNRADLVSGGDVLTEIVLPNGASASSVTVKVDGRDVSKLFKARPNHKDEGLLTGLKLGANSVVASLPDGRSASLTVTNHPIGGPIFAGPQLQPWTCQSTAKDKQCDQPPTFAYLYEPVTGGSLQSYDPENPPPSAEIASTTTTDGVTVPFIVREETGYIDRDQYAIATLWQPNKPWAPWAPQKQFNHRLVITHGAGCDENYQPASAPSVTDTKMLGGGFVLMSNASDNAGHNCNLVVEAESLVMTKEYVIDHYGEIKWTIGTGCSGGSLVQQQVANAYPGLYQGISPQCSFTDMWSSNMEYADYYMLLKYFEDPSRWDPGTAWTPAQISAVLDHPNIANPLSFTTAISNNLNPTHTCTGLPAAKQYNASTNKRGTRCDTQDYMINVFGKRAKDGFANRPFDNEGIQYGLKGLRQGLLTAAQFVDLNTHVGGLDIDSNIIAGRTVADPIALKRVYQTGSVDTATNLNQVAIIDLRGPDPGAFHDVYRTYAMRARLMRNFGTAANQLLWRGTVPLMGDANYADQAVFALDQWVARFEADSRQVPLATKIVQDRPGTVADRCTNGNGTDVPSPVCDELVQAYGTPRFGADEPMTDDIIKCQLKPMRADDYPVTFTAAQWSALKKAFPHGVCDYSKPGVSQAKTTPWLTYQSANGSVVYGGTPLGPAPVSVASGG